MCDNKLKNFLNGEFVDPKDVEYMEVINPADGKCIAMMPVCSAVHVDEAAKIAKEAFAQWSGMTIKQRASIMMKFHGLVDKHSPELAALVVKENGKNLVEAAADVAKGNETVDWSCGLPEFAAGRILEVSRGITCKDERIPLGVVAAIVPFNFPAMVPMWTIPIALTMGNCVILKPSEKVPMTMSRMTEFFIEAGVPPGVFQIVHGTAEVVTSLCDHPDISAVTFVGSSKVADIVYKRCTALNKRVLALGGAKNHLVALPDCDVGMAAKDIVASFAGCCGQRCMAASALIVVTGDDAEVGDGLINELVSNCQKLKAGQEGGQVGPLIDGLSLARVTQYIDAAAADESCKILLDGRGWSKDKPEGFWIGPTIILHSNAEDPAMKEEIFGPVLSVIKVKTWEEAIAIENNNPYGNAACIYTERGANAEWFVKRFRAGMLGVNIGIPVPREPFSFGGLYGTKSKYGDFDITGDGAVEFFSNRIKITSKWTASYGTSTSSDQAAKKPKISQDKANFDGVM
jgi:malonate-semialdehyde dehydrogenase (acetylating)/methylmalonate-semialdehyde dehydrogenase